jgi:hypothetical protein
MKKNIVIYVIIIIIIAFACFLVFYKQNNGFNFMNDLTSNKNFETFKNENLGFEFKYPINSNIKDIMNKGQYGLHGGGTIEDLDKSAKFYANGDSSLISRIIVDGQEARIVCLKNGYCNVSILSPKPMTLLGNPNKLYILVIGLPETTPEYSIQKKDLDSIISTFKFIEIKSPYEGVVDL